jgi:LEA14-like dessication related protein/PKD repeat protein
MGILRKVGVIVLVIVIVIAGIGAAFFTGVLGTPSAGLEDRGDWGNVSEEQTEVVTTVWVDNPNPIGVSVSDSVEVSYQLYLNDVNLANGEKSGLSIPAGNNTVQISTYIQNQDIPPWWVAFIQNNETIPIRADASADVGGTVSISVDFPTQEQTILTEETPIITSLSEVASGTEGTYTKNVFEQEFRDKTGLESSSLISERVTGQDGELTVGYEIQDGWAEWGEVTEDTTTVYFHFQIHNPGDVRVLAAPSNVGVDVEMNDLEMFSAQANDTSLQNSGDFSEGDVLGGRVLEPGETEEAVYAVEMNNENIDDWFKSHVRQGEQTSIRTEAKLVFSVQDVEFAVPADSPVSYTCELQTDILVDDQDTETNCGQIDSLELVDDTENQSDDTENESEENTDNGSEDDIGDEVENRTENEIEPPTAVAEANQTSGEARLNVTFDASGSSDPNGDIKRYVWRFDDVSTPAEGEQVTHTFSSAGQYEVELTVIDAQRNTATDTVSIDVDPEPLESPTAVAEANQTSGEAPLEVTFDAGESTASDTEIVEYAWRFDDRSELETGEQVSHTFSSEGQYTVELVVTDDEGNTASDTVTIDVAPESSEAPTAVGEANPTSGEAPLEVEFDASASSDPDRDIAEYIWRFKDGSTPASGETTTHTFRTAGEYDVELVVIDSEGNRDTTTVTVTVNSRFR